MKRLIFFSVLLITFVSCNTSLQLGKHKTSSFKKMEWLLGRWEIRTYNYFYSENWKKDNDTTYSGKSIMMVSGDTVLYDVMSIKPNKQYIYLSTKSSINTEGSLSIFKLTEIKKDRIIFENPSNKDEKKIAYILKSPEKISINIEGNEASVESYDLRKINK